MKRCISFLCKYVSKETLVFVCFIIAHLWIKSNVQYALAVVVLTACLYLVSQNMVETLWYSFLATSLFLHAKYFPGSVVFHDDYTLVPLIRNNVSFENVLYYFIAFSDVFLLLLIYWFKRTRQDRQEAGHVWPHVLFLCAICAGIVSSSFAVYWGASFFYLVQMIKYYFVFILAHYVLKGKAVIKTTLEFFFLFASLNGFLMIVEKMNNAPLGLPVEQITNWNVFGRRMFEARDVYRPSGITSDPNLIASCFGMLIPIACTTALLRYKVHPLVAWVSLFLMIIGLLLTGSRTVWVVCVCVLVWVYIRIKQHYTISVPDILRRHYKKLLLLSIMCVPFVVFRLLSLNTAFLKSGSGTFRLQHVFVATDIIIKHPLGIGFRNYVGVILKNYLPSQYLYVPTEPHNIILQVGTSIGIIGLLCYGGFLFVIYRRVWRVSPNKKLAFIMLSAMISYAGVVSFYPWFLYRPIDDIFWVITGFAYYETHT